MNTVRAFGQLLFEKTRFSSASSVQRKMRFFEHIPEVRDPAQLVYLSEDKKKSLRKVARDPEIFGRYKRFCQSRSDYAQKQAKRVDRLLAGLDISNPDPNVISTLEEIGTQLAQRFNAFVKVPRQVRLRIGRGRLYKDIGNAVEAFYGQVNQQLLSWVINFSSLAIWKDLDTPVKFAKRVVAIREDGRSRIKQLIRKPYLLDEAQWQAMCRTKMGKSQKGFQKGLRE